MPSVAIQTSWSWLKDLAEIKRLSELHATAAGFSISKEDVEDLTKQGSKINDNQVSPTSGIVAKNEGMQLEGIDAADVTAEEVTAGDTGSSVHSEELAQHEDGNPITSEDNETNPQLTPKDQSENELSKRGDDGIKLPVIVNTVAVLDDRTSELQEEMETKEESSSNEELKLPSLFDEFQQIDFGDVESSGEEGGQSDEDETVSGHLIDSNGEESDSSIKLPNLPWPAILQYLRESESLASGYFSLENKDKLALREDELKSQVSLSTNCAYLDKDHDRERDGENEEFEKSKSDSDEKDSAVSSDLKEPAMNCDFCGKRLPRISLLNAAQNKHDDKDMPYCCDEYKEFFILVAACMRQMVERFRHRKPKKISVKPHAKKSFKKSIEEKALALMRRKHKWDEIRRKRFIQDTSTKGGKNTKTIQFTLLSPSVIEKGWVVRPESSIKHKTPKQQKDTLRRMRVQKRREKAKVAKMEIFQPELLQRLREEAPVLRELVERDYSGGQKFARLLPDMTGQCYYPSGNIAVAIFSPYHGALAYLVYEDDVYPQLLACLDELGRACCYFRDGRIRFLLTPFVGILFDQQGCVRRRWKVDKGVAPTSPSLFQAISLVLNKHLTLKCYSQESMALIFSAQQEHIKFIINSKLKEECQMLRSSQVLTTEIKAMEEMLQKTKNRVSQLMKVLQNTHQVQKLSKLRSVYAPAKYSSSIALDRSHRGEVQNTVQFRRHGDASTTAHAQRQSGTGIRREGSSLLHKRSKTIPGAIQLKRKVQQPNLKPLIK